MPERVYIPFSQHAGTPAEPLVKAGDQVKIGTKIGAPAGGISAAVHSSIAGKVLSIGRHPHPLHGYGLCCVIESAGAEEWETGMKVIREYDSMSSQELLSEIVEAGIAGLGGGAFPTGVKLAPPPDKKIDTLIINGCESEPMLAADYRLMNEYPAGVAEGARIFKKIAGAQNLVLALESDKRDIAGGLENEGLKVKVLRSMYPAGWERLLIRKVLKREVPKEGLPMDVGCLVFNVATCYAGFQAVKFRKPLIERFITVTGSAIRETKNLLVRIGTPVQDIIDFCGGYNGKVDSIIFGGPMTGTAQFSELAPVIKGTCGIIALAGTRVAEERSCTRCGYCVDVCPSGLMPCALHELVRNEKFKQAEEKGLSYCIECGSCAYVCPAKIPLVHYFKFGKSRIKAA